MSTESIILLNFSAVWCGPCGTMQPVIQKVMSELEEKVTLVEVDVDKNKIVAKQYNIMNVPTFILLKEGKEVWRKVGLVSAKEMSMEIQKYF